jgi:hypothetical protein
MADCLHQAQKAVAAEATEAVLRRGNFAGLEPARVTVDVERIMRDLAEGKIDDILLSRSDWTQAILYGFENVSHLFSTWLSVTRKNAPSCSPSAPSSSTRLTHATSS